MPLVARPTAFVMFEGIAFETIIVAAVTSTFVARAAEEHGIAEDEAEARIEAKVDDISRASRAAGRDARHVSLQVAAEAL